MDKVKARMLKPYEKHKLKRMKRQLTNSVNRQDGLRHCLHARIILLSRGGLNNRQIASHCGCPPVRTVSPSCREADSKLGFMTTKS